ncbi:MAG: hypothetical protein ABR886_07210 [Dehalococcoidales bacterium]|jgi:hypothetical protein
MNTKSKKKLLNYFTLEYLILLGILVVIAICIFKRSFFVSGATLGASAIGWLSAALLASYGLKKQGMKLSRIFYVLATMVTAIWLFELLYHYSYGISWSIFSEDIRYISVYTTDRVFPLIWSLMMISMVFTGYKYMNVGRWFWITLIVSLALFLFWIWIGFPQWSHPDWFPTHKQIIPLIPRSYKNAPTETARNYIYHVSLVINSAAKIAISILPSTLFLGKDKMRKIDTK